MTLDEALREAAARGLTHLTLFAVPSLDSKKTYWAARAAPSTGHHYVQFNGDDPVEVLVECLALLPKARKRAEKPITAAVNPEPEDGE